MWAKRHSLVVKIFKRPRFDSKFLRSIASGGKEKQVPSFSSEYVVKYPAMIEKLCAKKRIVSKIRDDILPKLPKVLLQNVS